MKKFLAGTTALVAAAVVAGQAQAADPIKLSVGGFMTQYVAYIDHDNTSTSNYANVLNASNTEVYFRGSTKLDNGLTVAVRIDKEADRTTTTGTQNGMDDVVMSVSSDTLGKVELGATWDAVYTMSNKAPAHLSDNDFEVYFTNLMSAGDDDVMGLTGNDGQKVNYYSPSIAGFQLGLTYGLQAIGNVNSYNPVNLATSGHNYLIAGALAYKGEIAGVSVGADIGHAKVFAGGVTNTATPTTFENETTTRGGLKLAMAGFTVGGAYAVTNDYNTTQGRQVDAWEAGASYATGPYTIFAGYMNIEDNQAGTASDTESDVWNAGVTYDLGAGVKATAEMFHVAQDNAGPVATNDRDAFGIVTGISASF